MDQLPKLQARINSLQELRSLLAAMRSLAASHIREAEQAVAGIRRFSRIVEQALVDALYLAGGAVSPAGYPASAGHYLVVLGTEHGFVGALNDRLLDRSEALREPGEQLIFAGGRAASVGVERGLVPESTVIGPSKVSGLLASCRDLADKLTAAARIRLVYAIRAGGDRIEISCRTVLPLPSDLLESAHTTPAQPLHQLPPAVLLQGLVEEYLFGELTRAVTESFASENAARLLVMSQATRNIDQRLESLQRDWRELRQELITTELLDVIAGAEAQSRPPDSTF